MEKPASFQPLDFSQITGWHQDDHLDAFEAFRWSAKRIAQKPYKTKAMGINATTLADISLKTLESSFKGFESGQAARMFFEQHFQPFRIIPLQDSGFVTGYFEPEIKASKTRTGKFKFPVLKRPDDLVAITDEQRPNHMGPEFFFARKTPRGLEEHPDRGAIENGALDGRGLEIFWFESRIDIFFIHIQGSARLLMPDGTIERISYDGKSGHAFTPIGRLLIERGEIDRDKVTMQSIRKWLEDHPASADELMRENRSYIFFQIIDHPAPQMGPVAAAGVPLTAGRSLAVDHRLQTFGAPIFVVTENPLPGSAGPFRQLMIAQDTGSAIIGPARGDIFTGTGHEAGRIAGSIKHKAEFIILLPRQNPFDPEN